jgi:hypothetical protein
MADFATLEIWGPVLIYDASTSTWERQKRTLAQWQAAEDKEDYGLYSWDATPPPDGATKLEADAKFYIDADSAKAHGLRGKPAADDFELLVEHGITDFQDAKGCYWAEGAYGGETAYTNGHWWIYLHATYGWSIGQSLGSPPHFVASDGEGPQNTYLTNFDDFDDPTANPDWDQTQIVSVSEPDAAEKTAAAAAIDESNPSFNHDLTIVIDGWPLSCTSRTASPYVTDIAAIQHEPAEGILAEDDTLADFTAVADATAPDAGGNFEVEAAGGSIKYEVPNNWVSRVQTHIPAQDSIGGAAPEGYMAMRRDMYIGHATTPETAREGVYCWRGWRYLNVSFNAPAASTVTLTVRYYGDISVSENHKTDSTRQTELSVTLGDVTTLTRTEDVVLGANSVQFDLAPTDAEGNRLSPLHVVTEVEFAFADAGNWTITEPTLASVTQQAVKHFEHAAYARGGGSAIADGVHVCALYAFDEDSPNTIERTLANFSRLIGAKTGIDMTSAWSLAQWLSLAENCCNAWATSYSTAAADAAFKDADGTALKAPSVTDLQPIMGQDVSASGALSVACRVAQWTAVRGLKYDWTARKIVQGRIQGWVIGSDGEPVADHSAASNLWRRSSSADDWTQVESLSSDAYGRFASNAHATHDYDATEETSTLFDYGIGKGISTVASTGRFADREWDAWVVLVGGVAGAPWLHWMAGGWLHIAVTIDGIVRYYWVEPFRPTPILREAEAHPFGETGGFSNPFIISYSCGWLLAGATDANGMRLSRSEVFGDAWEEVTGGTLVDDLRNGCVDISDGFLIACGWKEGSVLFRTTSGRSFTPEAIHHGGPDNSVICESDAVDGDAPRSQVRWRGGAIEAMVETATGANLYRSPDWGATWTQIEAPHIADGMRGGNLAFIDGELLACGTEEGEVRAETAYRDTRVPESWWWTGPTYLTVVETAIASAIEAVHGERWVATGEDGISLYRLRSPLAGFEKII